MKTKIIQHSMLLSVALLATSAMACMAQDMSHNYVLTRKWLGTGASAQYVTDAEYYDGLGRLVQRQSSHARAGGGTLVQPVVHDAMQRQDATTYLPYVAEGADLPFREDPLRMQRSWYAYNFGEGRAFTETAFEDGLDGRPISSVMEGDAFSSTATTFSYGTNDASDNVMALGYDALSQTVSVNAPYPSGSIRRMTTIDADGMPVVEFSDVMGRKLLSRCGSGVGMADTYFVRDLRDSLVCVVQPEGSALLRAGDSFALDGEFAVAHCFTWMYDAWGNVTGSHVPGGGTTVRSYDGRDRMVSESDAAMRECDAERLFTYDSLDRLTRVVVADIGGSWEVPELERCYHGQSQVIPSALCFVEDEGVVDGGDVRTDRCIGMPAYERVYASPSLDRVAMRAETDGSFVERAFHYDRMGRLVQTVERSSDGWSARLSTKYDFTGNVLATRETHTSPSGESTSLMTSYDYDPRGRRLGCHRELDGEPLAEVSYSYDALGRLSGTHVGDGMADIAYSSDIHGWTTRIEAGAASDNGTADGRELVFLEEIRRADPAMAAGRYDGGIAEVTTTHSGSQPVTYAYSYDGLKRLAGADRYVGQSMVATDSDTERSISYDLDGNVTSLTRYDGSGIPETLSLSHAGGRLASVNGSPFHYDSNGNLTFDGRRGLEFTYNCVNLPKSATAADGRSLTYVCLSDGTKVSAMSGDGGLRYRGSFVYRVDPDGNETLESVAWDEGRIVLSQVADSLAAGPALLSALPDEPVDSMDVDALRGPRDLLYVRDHLGSVRSVLDVSLGLVHPEVVERSDYLPFGTRVEPAGAPSLDESRWRFSGKEEQRLGGIDLGLLDFGARWYDPALCRWTTPDPLAAKYPGLSPYCYCLNDPVCYSDPYGTNPIYDLDGYFLGTDDLGLQGDAIFMKKEQFTQGMANVDAALLDHGIASLSCYEALVRYTTSYYSLSSRPDWDGIVTPHEGIRWAKEHVGAKDNPTPENMLYVDASHLDFGNTSVSQFKDGDGSTEPINLFKGKNVIKALGSLPLINTVYALGRCNITLVDSSIGKVSIVGDESTDYDWNKGGEFKRRLYINVDRAIHGLNDSHGFKVNYYGYGYLRK